MRMRILRIALLVASAALVAYGALWESHTVWHLPESELKREGTFEYAEHALGGFAYTEGASREGFMLKRGEIYDAYSTVPVTDCAA